MHEAFGQMLSKERVETRWDARSFSEYMRFSC